MTAPTRYAAPRIIAIAGGKGGVGKSTIAVNLALAIGRMGHRVSLVDADLGAANLHTMLGVLHPPAGLADFLDQRVDNLDEVTLEVAPLVGLVPGTSRPGAANTMGLEKLRLLKAISQLEVDCVIIDIGAGTATSVVDMLTMADHKLIVMTPQLTSLHNAYALLKAAVHRTVYKLTTDEVQRSLIDSALAGETKARTITQLLDVLRPFDETLADRVVDILSRFGVGLVGNQITADSEAFAIARMTALIFDHLHIAAPLVAAIRRAPALAGGLKAGVGTIAGRADDSRASFRALAQSILDVDLAYLRDPHRRLAQPMPLWLAEQAATCNQT